MKKFLFGFVVLLAVPAVALAANTIGSMQQTIAVGRVLSVSLNPSPTGNWYVFSNSNPAAASASVSGQSLTVDGLAVGSTTVLACTDQQEQNCLSLGVTVTGSVLGESTEGPHKSGSWIINGNTVYYVSGSGLIPIPTWNIFLSNGGKAKNIVQGNASDFSLAQLPLMQAHDSRVK